jgi:hypothetical protein
MQSLRVRGGARTYLRENSFRKDGQQASLGFGAAARFHQHTHLGTLDRAQLGVETGNNDADLSTARIPNNDQLPDLRHNV